MTDRIPHTISAAEYMKGNEMSECSRANRLEEELQRARDAQRNAEIGLAEVSAENERLREDYALLEECSPPDWPRKDFVKHLFELWENKQALKEANE